MASAPLKIIVFLGTVRENRLGLRVAKFMMNQLTSTGHDATLFGKVPLIATSTREYVLIVVHVLPAVYGKRFPTK